MDVVLIQLAHCNKTVSQWRSTVSDRTRGRNEIVGNQVILKSSEKTGHP